jgi:hypothetical protein
MKFTPSTVDDIPQITDWIAQDVYHKDQNVPEFWLTGAPGCIFASCVEDARGPVMYARADTPDANGLVRMHVQFAPMQRVGRRRVVLMIRDGFPAVANMIRANVQSVKGIIFESVHPPLIRFMQQAGFVKSTGNDYVYMFHGSK